MEEVGGSNRERTSLTSCHHKDVFGSSVSKESACSTGDPGFISGSGRSTGEGNDQPLQYPCLENPMD